ncbi:MAG: flavodoxin family protein [Bacillota bacterium]|nr:flavodoxin family protein [Bacillota bacterium]
MKVIGINGSPRKGGNTTILINKVFEELNKQGIETELIELSGKNIKQCLGCMSCTREQDHKCIMTDDFYEIYLKISEAQGLLFGSPVYNASITSQMKAFIDRLGFATFNGVLKHKVGASVVAVRRGGAISAVDTLNHFFAHHEMFTVGSTYWNMVYGMNIGDVENDQEGIANMKNIGENMAWLLKKIHTQEVMIHE